MPRQAAGCVQVAVGLLSIAATVWCCSGVCLQLAGKRPDVTDEDRQIGGGQDRAKAVLKAEPPPTRRTTKRKPIQAGSEVALVGPADGIIRGFKTAEWLDRWTKAFQKYSTDKSAENELALLTISSHAEDPVIVLSATHLVRFPAGEPCFCCDGVGPAGREAFYAFRAVPSHPGGASR